MTKVTAPSSPTHCQVRRVCDHLGRAQRHWHVAIVYFGTDEQKKKYLPRLAREKLWARTLYRNDFRFRALNCAPVRAFAGRKDYI